MRKENGPRTWDEFGEVMTVRDTADMLCVSENFLRQRIAEGTLPGVTRLGRRILISKHALRHALEQMTSEGKP